MKKTVTIYELARLVMDYNGEKCTPERVHKFAKQVKKTTQVYINFAQARNLLN